MARRSCQPHVERARGGEQFEFEAFAPYPAGDRHIHAAFVPEFIGERVDGYFALITNLTHRSHTEQALRASVGGSAPCSNRMDQRLCVIEVTF